LIITEYENFVFDAKYKFIFVYEYSKMNSIRKFIVYSVRFTEFPAINEQFITKGILCSYDLHSCNADLLKIWILHTQGIRVHISEVVPSTKPKMLSSSLTIMLDI
jgi:hypothetical protein